MPNWKRLFSRRGDTPDFQPIALNKRTDNERRRGGVAWFFGGLKGEAPSLLRVLSHPAIFAPLTLGLAASVALAPRAQQWLAKRRTSAAAPTAQAPLFQKHDEPASPEAALEPAASGPVLPEPSKTTGPNHLDVVLHADPSRVQEFDRSSAAAPKPAPALPQTQIHAAAPAAPRSNPTFYSQHNHLSRGFMHGFISATRAAFGHPHFGPSLGTRSSQPKGFLAQGSVQSSASRPGGQGTGAPIAFSRMAAAGITGSEADGSSGPGMATNQTPCSDFKKKYAANMLKTSATNVSPCADYNRAAGLDTAVAPPPNDDGLEPTTHAQTQIWDGNAQNNKSVSSSDSRGAAQVNGDVEAVIGGVEQQGSPIAVNNLELPGTKLPPAANPTAAPQGPTTTAAGLLLYGQRYLYGIFY
jgi:hypothetical protein